MEVTGATTISCLKKKTVQHYVQRHVFAQSPPGRRPLLNIQPALRTTPNVCKSVSIAVLSDSNIIHIQFLRSQICVHTNNLHNLETLIGQKKYFKKIGDQCMPRAKEIFRSAVLGTRAIGSSALANVIISSFLLLCFHVIPYPTAFSYGNGMVLHFYQQQESSTTKTVHKVINKGLKAYV